MELNQRIAELEQLRLENSNNVLAGFKAGLQDFANQYRLSFQTAAEFGRGVAESLASNFTTAFQSIVNGSKSAKDAFKDLARSILADLAAMITKLLVYAAIAAALNLIVPGSGSLVMGAAGVAGGGGAGLFGGGGATGQSPQSLRGVAQAQAQPAVVVQTTNVINAIEPQTFAAYLSAAESQDVLRSSTRNTVLGDFRTRRGLRG